MQFAIQSSQPDSVFRLFCGRLFNIPVYQRPYEWEIDKCEKLWDDIESYFDDPDDEGYFLGILVLIAKDRKQFHLDVVDGQQRLISLSLLLRALYDRASENGNIRQCLYVLDDEAKETVGFRLTSEVHENEEQKHLQQWLASSGGAIDPKSENTYERNLAVFRQKVATIPQEQVGAFIKNLLENVYLLPVFCDNRDKALTIFETINNRGQDLTDADIFKAILYGLAKEEKSETDFIDRWNKLGLGFEDKAPKDDPRTFWFRCYMHILRGNRGDTTKTVGMRSFFIDGRVYKKEYVAEYKLESCSWQKTLDALERIKQAWIILDTTQNNTFQNWKYVLETFKNDVWVSPLVAFVYAKIRDGMNIDGQPSREFSLGCGLFMQNIIRFLHSKGFDNTLEMPAVQDEMFRATVCAIKNHPYQPNIKLHEAFKKKLRDNIKSPSFRKGFCAIFEVLTRLQLVKNGDWTDVGYVFQEVSVEHILPQTWEPHYSDIWNEATVNAVVNTLGNLCLLEKVLNIKGSHDFFSKKRKEYIKSEFMTAKNLVLEVHGDWTVDIHKTRHDSITGVIEQFLSNGYVD